MIKCKIAAISAAVCLLLAAILLATKGAKTQSDSLPVSRWARVDLTEYCGKTVGELIDSLGQDYVEFCPIIQDERFLRGFGFEYDGARIEVYPEEMQYCHVEVREGLPEMKDVRRERVRFIEILVG